MSEHRIPGQNSSMCKVFLLGEKGARKMVAEGEGGKRKGAYPEEVLSPHARKGCMQIAGWPEAASVIHEISDSCTVLAQANGCQLLC